ncbi:MAG: hypothetical protein ACQEUZ_14300 [Pseudomonadota bacterium]
MARRQRRAWSAAAAIGAVLALAGCETVSDYTPEVEFRALESSRRAPEIPKAPEELIKRPVASVDSLELGALRRGRLLLVEGSAPATRWYKPELRPRHDGRPAPDGFLEFDLVAAPPELNAAEPGPEGTPGQRRLRAARALSPAELAAAQGVRVYAAQGAQAVRFEQGEE